MNMENRTFNEELGHLLRNLRVESGMTQEQLAGHTKISRATIANMETGRQAMSAYQVHLIAKALELKSMNALFPMPETEVIGEITEAHSLSELNHEQLQQTTALMKQA
jgi:transcriptional regulator with XRE-family HTH domain